jgi:hypothetical protein
MVEPEEIADHPAVEFRDEKTGIGICEDAPEGPFKRAPVRDARCGEFDHDREEFGCVGIPGGADAGVRQAGTLTIASIAAVARQIAVGRRLRMPGVATSYAWAMRRIFASAHAEPTICIASGNPVSPKPIGTATAGSPATLIT